MTKEFEELIDKELDHISVVKGKMSNIRSKYDQNLYRLFTEAEKIREKL